MDAGGTSSTGGIPRIQVFRPTWEEFKDFNAYILHIEKCGAHKAGLAKIIPPPEWKPCKAGYDMDRIGEMEIPAPISQVVQGKQGVYQLFNILKKPMKVRDFRRMAESPKYATPVHFDYEELDRKYWRNIAYTPPIYGADVSGSLTDPDVKEWNINKLGSILDYVNEDYGISIEGVNTAYLYFGMWKSSFAWHTEDMDLYSINYIHFGEPKSWYSVPPEYGARLERLANNHFPSNYKECPAYLRHKMTVLSPSVLKTHSIPFNKIVQEAGEFMITFPYGYHAGFNHGFNCAESTNFASPRWVEYGKRATQCACRPDMVKISMDTFVQRFQPEKYDLWLQGKDYGCHPEVPGKYSAAPHPSREEILCNKNHNQSVPESFSEPTKKKAKRHLVHKQPDADFLQAETPPPDLTAEPEYSDVPLPVQIDLQDADSSEQTNDEETYEIMKDVLFKAGEMDSDGLDEWEPSSKSKRSKKPTKSRATKSSSSGSGNDSPRPGGKVPARASAASKQQSAIQRVKAVDAFPASPSQEAKTPVPTPAPTLATPSNGLSRFRIPKKSHSDDGGRPWTEEENSVSQALLNLGGTQVKTEEGQKRYTQPPALVRYGPSSEQVHLAKRNSSSSPPPLLAGPSSDGHRAPAIHYHQAYRAEVSPLVQQIKSAIKTEPNGSVVCQFNEEDPSVAQQRRSRKQKSPRIHRTDQQERETGSVSVTASRLLMLWRCQKEWTLGREAEFNWLGSQKPPHCAICALFYVVTASRNNQQQEASDNTLPLSSPVLVPEELYTRSPIQRLVATRSALLSCTVCRVCVHSSCYGVGVLQTSTTNGGDTANGGYCNTWLCRRCEQREEAAKCCLCLQRGGALKPTSDGRWAHISCALCLSEVSFGQPAAREPIIVSQVGRGGAILSNCFYCNERPGEGMGGASSVFYKGVCVACENTATCNRTFHPACGLLNGVRFRADGSGNLIATCCSSATPVANTTKRKVSTTSHLAVGQLVYAKHPANGIYTLAEVINNGGSVTHYFVDFSDGSRSRDVLPEDIRNYDCITFGPPPLGAAVQVMWTDGCSYSGHFRGQVQLPVYRLRFAGRENGGSNGPGSTVTEITAERSEIHHPSELPRTILDQLGSFS